MPNRQSAFICMLLFVAAGCTKTASYPVRLQSFVVTLSQLEGGQDVGSSDEPMAVVTGTDCDADSACPDGETCVAGNCSTCFSIDVEAINSNGELMDYNGPAAVDVTPGHMAGPSTIVLEKGEARGSKVCFNRATGLTNLWVEHDGFVPKPSGKNYGQCNDGIDNDNNGLIDLADGGCTSAKDDLEAPVTQATGISPTIYFTTPTVRQVQKTAAVRTSPLVNEEVRIDRGSLLVTNVVGHGFYMTDTNDSSLENPFASLFVFTFSQPKGVRLGHLVCWVAGSVQEHVGHSQIVFPSFLTFDPESADGIPALCDRDDIDDAMLALRPHEAAGGTDITALLEEETSAIDSKSIGANAELLESYESAFVQVHNISVSERFIACDRDGNGRIEKGTPESTCRDECQKDPLCTDLEGYFEYHQWLGRVDGRKTMGFSRALAARFAPLAVEFEGDEDAQGLCDKSTTPLGFLEYTCPPRVLLSVSGSVRHIYLCNSKTGKNGCPLQFWVLDPRFDADVVFPPDLDQDGDGYSPSGGDCDDNNLFINPDAKEIPSNGRDDDCDGVTK